jgi:acyl-CoA synthetase (AMP-forming)/AMP-acid ligase II
VSILPFVQPARLVARLADHGGRVALLGNGAPDGGLTYADLAQRVQGMADRLGPVRRLVMVEGANDVESVVAYLGALAAGCPVLLTGPGAARDLLASAYSPDVVWSPAGGLVEHRAEPAVELHPDLALLLSTSGTTGSPKLVRLSRDNLLANARSIAEYLEITDRDVAVTTLPMHYCYGLSVVHSHLLRGATLLLSDRSVTDPAFWDEARSHRVTSFAGVPYTFELLDSLGFTGRELPSLRYVTQAGGRMPPETVRRYAGLGKEAGFDLVVMYGATEATARMAWLPPLLAEHAPETIGIPIPGGSLAIEPVDGVGPEVGELVYRGDNVMLGYAESPAELALGRTVHELRTGDLARQRDDGLFEVVGRRSRFAKVFGLRVDLDRVERTLADRGIVAAAADGGDRLVVGMATGASPVDPAHLLTVLREEVGLAPSGIRLVTPPELPRLASGKTDYRALAASAVEAVDSTRPDPASTRSTTEVSPGAVAHVYAELLGRPDATADHSFVDLRGDSLTYVEASLRLESLLGTLPADWPSRTARDLAAAARPARPGRMVEGSVLLRALTIVAIVGSHANLLTIVGGAHVLLAVLGFNFGRFHVDVPLGERPTALARTVARIAVPSVLVIGVAATWTEGLGWQQVLLLNGFLGPQGWAEPQWYYWFVESAVLLTVAAGLLLLAPPVHRLARRAPFGLPLALLGLALVPRYYERAEEGSWLHGQTWLSFLPNGDVIHSTHAVAWLFVLGWAASQARSVPRRLLVSAVVVAVVPGFIPDQPEREVLVVLGVLALVWVSRLRIPRAAAVLVGWLAGASLWIYLLHWQVYPHLEHDHPALATVLSLLVGVLAWQAWERGARRLRECVPARRG